MWICKLDRYSVLHLGQKWRWMSFMRRHLWKLDIGCVSTSCTGNSVEGSRVKKWRGVKTERREGSLHKVLNVPEFKVACTCVTDLISSLLINLCIPIHRRINDLVDLTPASAKIWWWEWIEISTYTLRS